MRHTSFGEKENLKKYYAIIKDSDIEIKPLNNYYKIKTVDSFEELQDLNNKIKVRIVFKNFDYYKRNIDRIQKYQNIFEVFTVKLDFENTIENRDFKRRQEKHTGAFPVPGH